MAGNADTYFGHAIGELSYSASRPYQMKLGWPVMAGHCGNQ
jgi:hypothetical protein